jgi:hypothetical protein
LVPIEVAADVDVDRAIGAEIVEDPREPAFEEPGSRYEQEMRVTALRDLSARLRPMG